MRKEQDFDTPYENPIGFVGIGNIHLQAAKTMATNRRVRIRNPQEVPASEGMACIRAVDDVAPAQQTGATHARTETHAAKQSGRLRRQGSLVYQQVGRKADTVVKVVGRKVVIVAVNVEPAEQNGGDGRGLRIAAA